MELEQIKVLLQNRNHRTSNAKNICDFFLRNNTLSYIVII